MVISVCAVSLALWPEERRVATCIGSAGSDADRRGRRRRVHRRPSWTGTGSTAPSGRRARPVRRARRRGRAADRRRPRHRRLPPPRGRRARAPHADLGLGTDAGVELTVNGERRAVDGAWGGESLLYVLRERLGLPGLQERVRAGRVRLVLGLPRRRGRLRLPRARRRRRRAARSSPSRGWRPATSCTSCSARSSSAAPCSAASARPGLIVASHDLLRARPATRARPTSARRSPATSAAAPATRRSSTPSSSPRSGCDERRHRALAPDVRRAGRIGDSPLRADGVPKVRGEFAYAVRPAASRGCCGARRCAARTRAPASRALDTAAARARCPASTPSSPTPTCPAARPTGSSTPTSPCSPGPTSASRASRSRSSPPTTPRPRAAPPTRSPSSYEVLEPVTDPEAAMAPGRAARCTRAATCCARVVIEHGEAGRRRADVVVRGRATRSGCRTRRSSARSPASRCPTARAASTCTSPPSGCTSTATRSPRASALAPEQVRLVLGGVGGAFGGREDLSMQIHACLLALRTGRPVKMVYGREESFVGHVHRHPARMEYEHGATRDGRLVFVRARIVLDGGAYASSSTAVCSNAACFAAGPYAVPNARIDRARRLHEQPAVRRDARLRRRPGRVRATRRRWTGSPPRWAWTRSRCALRNAIAPGDRLPDRPGPARARAGRRAARAGRARSAAGRAAPATPDQRELPGGVANTTHGEGVRRGVGYAVGLQERRLLRGLRRLLDRARAGLARRGRAARRGPHRRGRGRPGRADDPGADRAHRAGDRARRACCPPTPRSARPARRPRRARPT